MKAYFFSLFWLGWLSALAQSVTLEPCYAAVQLDNGVIAARDHTTELNNENQALLNQKLHELQLLLAQIQYRTLTGN